MRQDYFSANNIKHIDYKDIDILKKFINANARITGKRRTGIVAKNQRSLAMAIKRARFMGLLPYVQK